MHVIDRNDASRSSARRAPRQADAFRADGPREQGALSRVALRVISPGLLEPQVDLGEGLEVGSSRRRPTSTTTSTTSRSTRAIPQRPRGPGSPSASRPCRRCAGRGRRSIRRVPRGRPRRPRAAAAATTSPCSSTRPRSTRAEAEELGIEIDDFVDAPNTLAVFLSGPDRVQRRVRRAQADLLARAELAPDRGRGHGRPRRRRAGPRARARARSSTRRATAPGARCCSRAASSAATGRSTGSGGVPGRRPGAAAPRGRGARRRARLARVARRAGARAGDRQPATVGWRFDPRRLTEALVRAAGDVRLGTPFERGAACSRRAASGRGSPGSAASRCARTRGARATGSTTGSPAAPTSRGMDEFYGRAISPAARAGASRLRARRAAVRPLRARADDGGRESFAGDAVVARERPRPGARAASGRGGLVRRRGARAAPSACASGRSPRSSRPRGPGRGRPAAEELPSSCRSRRSSRTAVRRGPVRAAVTHTIGGLRIDEHARVLGRADRASTPPAPTPADLHRRLRERPGAALVFGRRAAESADQDQRRHDGPPRLRLDADGYVLQERHGELPEVGSPRATADGRVRDRPVAVPAIPAASRSAGEPAARGRRSVPPSSPCSTESCRSASRPLLEASNVGTPPLARAVVRITASSPPPRVAAGRRRRSASAARAAPPRRATRG